jgi:hypothetical protein
VAPLCVGWPCLVWWAAACLAAPGPVAGLRDAAWSLIPLAAYLTGVIALFWQVGAAVTRFAVRFVFSPTVWVGVITTGISAVLFVTAGVLRRRGIGSRHPAVPRSGSGKAEVRTQTVDDDIAEIELLHRRGIK